MTTSGEAYPRRRSVPAHQRLSRDLRERLKEGHFRSGERLPTEAELEREYNVSRQTVRRAFQDLVAEGLVRRIPGRGTFAAQVGGSTRYARPVGSIDELMEWNESEMEITRPMTLTSDADMASRLELPSPVVAMLGLRRTYSGLTFGVTKVFLSPAVAQHLVESDALKNNARTVIRAVEQYLPSAVAGVQQVMTAVAAPEDIAAELDLEPGAPVLRAERLFFDTEETPVEVSVTHYHPDRYAYRLELRGQVGVDPRA